MSETIHHEILFFFQSFSYGFGVFLVYDILRAMRRVIKRGMILLSIEDFTFWTLAFLGFFLLIQWENNGAVRGFSVVALFLGMVFYYFLIGRAVLVTFTYLFDKIKQAVCLLIHTLLWPLCFIAKKCKNLCQKILKKQRKRVKMALQHKRGRNQLERAGYETEKKKKRQ